MMIVEVVLLAGWTFLWLYVLGFTLKAANVGKVTDKEIIEGRYTLTVGAYGKFLEIGRAHV